MGKRWSGQISVLSISKICVSHLNFRHETSWANSRVKLNSYVHFGPESTKHVNLPRIRISLILTFLNLA